MSSQLAERAVTLATSGPGADGTGAVNELIKLAGDVDELEKARDELVRRILARSDDFEATRGLALVNAAIAKVGPKAAFTWKPKKWRLPR